MIFSLLSNSLTWFLLMHTNPCQTPPLFPSTRQLFPPKNTSSSPLFLLPLFIFFLFFFNHREQQPSLLHQVSSSSHLLVGHFPSSLPTPSNHPTSKVVFPDRCWSFSQWQPFFLLSSLLPLLYLLLICASQQILLFITISVVCCCCSSQQVLVFTTVLATIGNESRRTFFPYLYFSHFSFISHQLPSYLSNAHGSLFRCFYSNQGEPLTFLNFRASWYPRLTRLLLKLRSINGKKLVNDWMLIPRNNWLIWTNYDFFNRFDWSKQPISTKHLPCFIDWGKRSIFYFILLEFYFRLTYLVYNGK